MSSLMWAYEFERTFDPLPTDTKDPDDFPEEKRFCDTLKNVFRMIFGREPK